VDVCVWAHERGRGEEARQQLSDLAALVAALRANIKYILRDDVSKKILLADTKLFAR
jgi:hypothetical protein